MVLLTRSVIDWLIDRRSCARKTAATASTCDRCVRTSDDASARWRRSATPRWKRCGRGECGSGRWRRWRGRSCWRRSWKRGDSRSSRDVRYILPHRFTLTVLCIVFCLAGPVSLCILAALCNRAGRYIFALWFLSFFFFLSFFSSPNLSSRRLDVYHTSTHGVALVRI